MRRIIFWAILGGVVLIAGVIVFQLLGTYLYMRSPQRVVDGAFIRLLEAKSFDVSLEAADDAKDGLSFNVSGSVDKWILTAPIADLNFSFQAQGQSFYGAGQAQARDGQIYLRFDQIAGIPGVLPGALQSIWAGLGVETLLAVGKDRLFSEAAGNFTEADLQAIVAIAKKHQPFIAVKTGDQLFIDNVLVVPYDIVLDRPTLGNMILEIKTAVKGSPLSDPERADLSKTIASLYPVSGQVWVAKNNGALRAALFVAKGPSSSFHLNLRFSNYDKTVAVDPPMGAQPLVELLRRLTGTSLAGVKMKLPFEIPLPIWDIEMKMPSVPTATTPGAASKPLGGLPNLIKLFYGTDQPFSSTPNN